jgi:hypothetical protein
MLHAASITNPLGSIEIGVCAAEWAETRLKTLTVGTAAYLNTGLWGLSRKFSLSDENFHRQRFLKILS